MSNDTLDFTPDRDESLSHVDVKRCFIASDVADRLLSSAIDAAWNLMGNVPHESRAALTVAHMQVAAIAYAAERLACGGMPAQPQTNDE